MHLHVSSISMYSIVRACCSSIASAACRCSLMCAGAVLQRRLQATCLNLLEQLGALCASQTRKDTILQGKQPGPASVDWICGACKAPGARRSVPTCVCVSSLPPELLLILRGCGHHVPRVAAQTP